MSDGQWVIEVYIAALLIFGGFCVVMTIRDDRRRARHPPSKRFDPGADIEEKR